MRIKKIERLIVKYHEQIVGTLSLTPDNKQCAFEYDKAWLSNGFSISPLELPLKPGLFIAKPSPFYGNFGVFEDSLPSGCDCMQTFSFLRDVEAACREIFTVGQFEVRNVDATLSC